MPCEDMQTTGRDTTNTAHYPSRTPLLPILRSHTVLMCMHMRLRRRRLLQWRRLRRRPLNDRDDHNNPTNNHNNPHQQTQQTAVLRPPMWVAQAPMAAQRQRESACLAPTHVGRTGAHDGAARHGSSKTSRRAVQSDWCTRSGAVVNYLSTWILTRNDAAQLKAAT